MPPTTPASGGPPRPVRRPPHVAERGVVEGVLAVALPDVTAYGVRLTSLLVQGSWYCARGDRPDLLDDDLLGQRVRLRWHRYERSTLRYLDGQVTLSLPDGPRAPVRPRPARPTQ